mmetsp:Transcript_28860/g.85238  ORF Transcript_28860/g.85238 Transcript_28860/m.85238 type:complete len:210 (-) Transcript_28860:3056-3685(-)
MNPVQRWLPPPLQRPELAAVCRGALGAEPRPLSQLLIGVNVDALSVVRTGAPVAAEEVSLPPAHRAVVNVVQVVQFSGGRERAILVAVAVSDPLALGQVGQYGSRVEQLVEKVFQHSQLRLEREEVVGHPPPHGRDDAEVGRIPFLLRLQFLLRGGELTVRRRGHRPRPAPRRVRRPPNCGFIVRRDNTVRDDLAANARRSYRRRDQLG